MKNLTNTSKTVSGFTFCVFEDDKQQYENYLNDLDCRYHTNVKLDTYTNEEYYEYSVCADYDVEMFMSMVQELIDPNCWYYDRCFELTYATA